MPKKDTVPSTVTKPVLDAIETVQMLAICINPADEESVAEDGAPTRETTEWFVVVPDLSLVFKPLDHSGKPITGFWPRREAEAYIGAYVRKAIRNPEYLAYAREHPEVTPMVPNTYGKYMPVTISIYKD